MDSPELNYLEENVRKIKNDISALEDKIKELKDTNNNIINRLDFSSQELALLKVSIYKDIANLTSELLTVTTNIKEIKNEAFSASISIKKIEEKLDKVNNNSLLSFTSEIDVKKFFSILLILLSISTSPALITNLISNHNDEQIGIKQTEKLREVLDLLKELETDSKTP